jgi:ribosomal protein L24
VEDTLTFARFQCFDFEGMEKYPQVLEPLLFYVLHRANAAIYDPAQATVFKLFVLDEAWRFMRDPTINAYITEVGSALAAVSHRPQMPYSFRAVNAVSVNAYTFPAGSVAVNRGLLIELQNESQLAGVVAHVSRERLVRRPRPHRVIVEGVNMIKRHTKPTNRNQQGGIIEREAPIHISNVMPWCEALSRPSKIVRQRLEDGSRVRVYKVNGETLND